MVVTLRLNIVVFTVLFSSKMTFIIKVRNVVFQIPITLFKVSVGVVLEATAKLFFGLFFHGVGDLIWSLLLIEVLSRSKVRRFILILLWLLLVFFYCRRGRSRGRLRLLLLLMLFVHLSEEKSRLGSQVLFSPSLTRGRLGMSERV